MAVSEDKMVLSVVIDKEVKEQLEKYAAELDMSVSRFAGNCIYVALDDYKILKKTGIIRMCLGFRSMMESFQKNGLKLKKS